MGIIGGYIIAVGYYNMAPNAYLDPLPIHVTTFDFLAGYQIICFCYHYRHHFLL